MADQVMCATDVDEGRSARGATLDDFGTVNRIANLPRRAGNNGVDIRTIWRKLRSEGNPMTRGALKRGF